MLTSQDLKAISDLIDQRLEQKLEQKLEKYIKPLKKDIHHLRRDMNAGFTDVHTEIRHIKINMDKIVTELVSAHSLLENRVTKIEKYLEMRDEKRTK